MQEIAAGQLTYSNKFFPDLRLRSPSFMQSGEECEITGDYISVL